MLDQRQEYQEVKEKLLNLFKKYEACVAVLYQGDEALMGTMEKRLANFTSHEMQIRENAFSVVVIGEMKHGKSTLLNALLRKPAFPKAVEEATATVSYLKHNDTAEKPEWRNKAVVFFMDETREPVVVEHTELKDYTTCLGEKLNVAEEVKEVHIYSDSPFVEDRVSVVDTPGTNTTVSRHNEITETQIERSNAAIFLFKANAAGKKSDFEFLSSAARSIHNFFFVVNRIDEVGGMEEAPRLIENILSKLREYEGLEDLKVTQFYPTAGLLALLARYGYLKNEKYTEEEWRKLDTPEFREELEEKSGLKRFEDDLMTFLFKGERMKVSIESHLSYLEECRAKDAQMLADRREVLEGQFDTTKLENERTQLELQKEKHKGEIELASESLKQKLEEEMTEFQEEVRMMVQNARDKFSEDLRQDYPTYPDLKLEEETISELPQRRFIKLRNDIQAKLRETVKGVFKAQDTRLRGKINEALEQIGVDMLPELPDLFSKRIKVSPVEVASQEVEELKAQIEEMNRQMAGLEDSSEQYEILKAEFDAKQQALKDAQQRLDQKISLLGSRPEPVVITTPGSTTYEDRDGFWGTIGQWFIGPRAVYHPPTTTVNTDARDDYDRTMKAIEEQRAANERRNIEWEEANRRKLTQAELACKKQERLEQAIMIAEKQKKEAKEVLRQKEAEAKKSIYSQTIRALNKALEEATDQLLEVLTEAVHKCTDWADTYISDIQAEVDEFMRTKGAELDSLQQRISMTVNQKEEAQKRLDEQEKALQELGDEIDREAMNIRSIYR